MFISDSMLTSLMSVDLNEIAKPKEMVEDTNVNPEDNTVHFIAIILECLALLRRLPEAIDVRYFYCTSIQGFTVIFIKQVEGSKRNKGR